MFQGCRRGLSKTHDDGTPHTRGCVVMRAEISNVGDDTPTAILLRECVAKTVDALIAELRRRPIVQPEWLSLQETATYCGYSEQQFSDFVKRGIAPPSVLFSRNARRFKRTDVDAWCASGGPSQFGKKTGTRRTS
jgi:predicted DNA-binding transcriptional regulator AlpA